MSSGAPGKSDQSQAMARAEEMVDQAGERVGTFVATLSQRLQVLMARAREEAEDIWAEAQSMRQKDQI